jgi:hypothetical protein
MCAGKLIWIMLTVERQWQLLFRSWQVELVSRTANHQPERSEPLVIDTHRAPQVTFQSSFLSAPSQIAPASEEPSRAVSQGSAAVSSPLLSVLVNRDIVGEVTTERRQQLELLAGTGTAVLLFLVVVGILAWRCRRHSLTSGSSAIKSKKLVEDAIARRAGAFLSLSTKWLFRSIGKLLTRFLATV